MDTLGIIRQMREDPALRDELRSVLLSQELLQLPERLAKVEAEISEIRHDIADMDRRLTSRLDAMDKRLDTMDKRFDAMDKRLDTMDKRFDAMDKRFDAMDKRFDAMDKRFDAMQVDVGDLKGSDLERRVREAPRRHLGRFVRHATSLTEQDLDAAGGLGEDDAEYLRYADVVVRGEDPVSGAEVLGAVEVAWTAHQDDLSKALRRADLLARSTGTPVLPLVVSQQQPAQVVVDRAHDLGVGVVLARGGSPLAPASPRTSPH
ncbi:MAG: hypothetical protein ACRDZX_06640 [Acidimicrobiales bacterium]